MKRISYINRILICTLAFALALALSACGADMSQAAGSVSNMNSNEDAAGNAEDADAVDEAVEFLAEIPEYSGEPFCYVNDNEPDFEEDEIWTSTQESLDPLDELGRCGTANSCIGLDGMPTEPRGNISSVEPTGWHTDTYEFVEGELLYNRCHLIGYQLSGDDAVPRNLITGTSYMNRDGMLKFENAIASYVKETGNHVMYRVTPVFVGDELIARGVHMQAVSVEDDGEGLAFNVYCYNVQPGVEIDYATGDNKLDEDSEAAEDNGQSNADDPNADETVYTVILNSNPDRMRYHMPDCRGVDDISEDHYQKYEITIDEIVDHEQKDGWIPCGWCHPDKKLGIR